MKLALFFTLFFALLFPLAAEDNSAEAPSGQESVDAAAEKDYDSFPEESYDEEYGDEDFFEDDLIVMEGNELTVVASSGKNRQARVVDRETIEKTHAPDLPALLEETLGMGVTRYGPYGSKADVNLRGFNTKRIAVLVDGIQVNSSASGDFDFNSVDLSSIERIEVVPGGSDTKYNVSGALGGVINIITVKKQNPGWSFGGGVSNTSYLPDRYNTAEAGVGEHQWQDLADAQNLNVFGAYGADEYSLRFNVFGNRAGNHFLYMDDFGYARRKEGNEVLDAGTSLSYIREFQDLSKFIATGAFYFGDKNIPVSGYSPMYAAERDFSSRENMMFEMPRAFHDDFSMSLSLGHNWKQLHYDPGFNASLHNEHALSVINRWDWYPVKEITFRLGGDYSFIHLDSTNSGMHYAHRGGLYITSEYSPVRQLFLAASVKGMTNGKDIIPVPKLGLSWTINDIVTLKNNYFRSFKFPDFDDLYWAQSGFMGNPGLKSEDGWGADIGLDISYNGIFDYSGIFYGQRTEDSIHWSYSSGLWKPENSGTAAFFGWDNRLRFKLPFSQGILEKPVVSLSWLFQLSWLLSGNLAFADGKRIPYMPAHTLGISLELPWKSKNKKLPGSFAVSGRFESSRFADTENAIKLEPCFILDIVYNQDLNTNLSIFGKLNNVLNAHYVSFADYPMSGISMSVGVNMTFNGTGEKGGNNL